MTKNVWRVQMLTKVTWSKKDVKRRKTSESKNQLDFCEKNKTIDFQKERREM